MSYISGEECDDNCMANGLGPDGKACGADAVDPMVCDHFCWGNSCGWDCKVGTETVADCASGMSYISGEECDDNCMANGLDKDDKPCGADADTADKSDTADKTEDASKP